MINGGGSNNKSIIRETPEVNKSMQISKEENQEEAKKERCEPCLHCGVHCIFLKEEK